MATKVTTESVSISYGNHQTSGAAAVNGEFVAPSSRAWFSADDVFTGVENRNYKHQIRVGSQATTAASGIKRSFRGAGPIGYVYGFTSTAETPTFARRASIQGPSTVEFGGTVSEARDIACQNVARTKFSKKVEKTMTLFSGGVFLGELRETLRMIRNPAKALRGHVNEYLELLKRKQGRLRRQPVLQRERILRDTWLEASFGWMPFLNDLDEAKTYLERRQEQLYRQLEVVKTVNEENWIVSDTTDSSGVGAVNVSWRKRNARKSIAVLAGGIKCQSSSRQLINASAMGLAPRSFVPTLWELVPWSFAIDYFSNVGDVIQGWSNQTVVLSWGRETVVREATVSLYNQRVTPISLAVVKVRTLIPGNYLSSKREFSRVPILNPPVPQLAFELPGFGLKWLNLAALAKFKREIRLT